MEINSSTLIPLFALLFVGMFIINEITTTNNNKDILKPGLIEGIQYSQQEVENVFAFGKQYVSNKTIRYENKMEEYIKDQYFKFYPNEMGLCVEANITDDEILIYGFSDIRINYQTEFKVNAICLNFTNHTIALHSHTNIIRNYNICLPSKGDFIDNSSVYKIIVCGNETDIIDTISFKDEI